MRDEKKKRLVIIPAYNEEGAILKTVRDIEAKQAASTMLSSMTALRTTPDRFWKRMVSTM